MNWVGDNVGDHRDAKGVGIRQLVDGDLLYQVSGESIDSDARRDSHLVVAEVSHRDEAIGQHRDIRRSRQTFDGYKL